MDINLPIFKVAAVQDSPVFLNVDATIDKVCAIIAKASANGADLVAFPEVFVSGYPYWNWIMSPIDGGKWYEKLYRNSIDVPGPAVERIYQAAKEHNVVVVIGVNERGSRSLGVIYNTVLVISEQGELIGKHRKLVPTWAEKLTWTGGDGSSLNVYDTKVGPLGVLACGENTNTLARFALLAQGELVHVSNYIALPTAPKDYDMARAIEIRTAAHAFEGKIFNITSCSTISEYMIEQMEQDCPNARQLLTRSRGSWTGVIGPDGQVIGEPLIDKEGIVYADIDLSKCIQPKQMHDIIGHYNRFDIFDFRVNKSPQEAASFTTKNISEKSGENEDTEDDSNL
ncbi:MAG TPA: carbon-nitrogen hydrolase family protein [Candidatus Thioglobus sp.]|jgi:aliphatic nitrilase|nr:carbon-nitrogen hydrolase family protein [Candidatus Thioglobus sp.]